MSDCLRHTCHRIRSTLPHANGLQATCTWDNRPTNQHKAHTICGTSSQKRLTTKANKTIKLLISLFLIIFFPRPHRISPTSLIGLKHVSSLYEKRFQFG